MGVLIFGGLRYLIKLIGEQFGIAEDIWFDFIRNTIAGLALIWIGTEVSSRLGWFERKAIA